MTKFKTMLACAILSYSSGNALAVDKFALSLDRSVNKHEIPVNAYSEYEYDKGHMPAAEISNYNLKEPFILSNIAPKPFKTTPKKTTPHK